MDERIKTREGEFNARGMRFGIVASRFNDFIVDRLLDAAVDTLLKHGAAPADIEVVRVPGAIEMPLASWSERPAECTTFQSGPTRSAVWS